MNLEELFLKKEELPIRHRTCFQIPIHPVLLDENTKINPSIAEKVFIESTNDWYEDLKTSPLCDREFIERIKGKIPFQDSHIIGCDENGFTSVFQISRDNGGALYFDKDDDSCITTIPNQYIKFSKEKIDEFKTDKTKSYALVNVYAPTNIDEFSGALFLRNWAIKYMNEVFKQIF